MRARRRARAPKQLLFTLPIRYSGLGGKRPGAGRKKVLQGDREKHRPRKALKPSVPLHITVRVLASVWSLRSDRAFKEVHRALKQFAQRRFTRLIGYSVQGNHIHLVIESENVRQLGFVMRGFASLLARLLNKMMGTRGRVIADRYHLEELPSPRRVWNALVYVAKNTKKHAKQAGRAIVGPFTDPFTSLGGWFAGVPYSACGTGPPLGVAPVFWLLRDGWRRADPRR